jgi:hypothetical protein
LSVLAGALALHGFDVGRAWLGDDSRNDSLDDAWNDSRINSPETSRGISRHARSEAGAKLRRSRHASTRLRWRDYDTRA